MSAELDALGGGDTRVAQLEGYCISYPNADTTDTILSLDYEKNIVTVRFVDVYICLYYVLKK